MIRGERGSRHSFTCACLPPLPPPIPRQRARADPLFRANADRDSAGFDRANGEGCSHGASRMPEALLLFTHSLALHP